MIEAFQHSPALAVAATALFGLLMGSFLNVVIHRLPRMLEREWAQQAAELRGEPAAQAAPFNLLVPRSQCPACGHPIRAVENVPLLSWLLQRGRCTACRAAIPLRYPVVEATTAVLCAVAVARFGWSAAGLAAVVLTCFLIALAFIDLDTQLLPDSMTLPLLWIGLGFNLWEIFAPLPAAVIGAIAGYLSLWSVYWLFKLVTGKEGMGYGDFKLFAALGAWFGWGALPAVILLASVVGAIVGLALMAFARHRREVPIPFGPYLAGAGLLALYFRDSLASIYGLG